MPYNYQKVLPIEKILSVLSYLTMGIVGLIWIIFANLSKQKVKYFLFYNIIQSIIISVFLAVFNISLDIILSLLAKIPYFDWIAAILNIFLTFEIIKIFNMSFTVIGFIVILLIVYIIIGVLIGRIFYIPFLTNIIQKTVSKYC